ncbi:hypothetical protein [Nocardia sp. NPDC050710]|uniref:hypothetical protein n=1 Tax=Nocardia sp. NPDC050710 TaxID=3157220 RepID=UPI0033F149D9
MTEPRNLDGEGFGEFAEELKLLAETVLERVEPVLRHAADGQTDWSSCSWCPVCAAAALMRGEHHDVVTAIADHGTAIVTVLREALAGIPVEPVLPPDADPEDAVPHDHRGAHRHSHGLSEDTEGETTTDKDAANGAPRDERTESSATGGRRRSRYVGIPVTIKV